LKRGLMALEYCRDVGQRHAALFLLLAESRPCHMMNIN
jgi:hypothetical protein